MIKISPSVHFKSYKKFAFIKLLTAAPMFLLRICHKLMRYLNEREGVVTQQSQNCVVSREPWLNKRLSVGLLVNPSIYLWSIRPSLHPSIRLSATPFFGGQKQRRQTTYAMYLAFLRGKETEKWTEKRETDRQPDRQTNGQTDRQT